MPATSRRLAACSSRCLLAVTLALLSGGFQFAVAFRVDFLLTPRQHILRRDVADGTVQADVVVMLDVSLHQAQRIVQRERCGKAAGARIVVTHSLVLLPLPPGEEAHIHRSKTRLPGHTQGRSQHIQSEVGLRLSTQTA